MTDKDLKVYVGEDRLPVHDLTDYVDWPDSRFISQAYNGESSVSSIVFRDENSEFGPWSDSPITIAARNEIEVKHGSNFLFRGRAIGRTWERGAQKAFKAREVVAEAEDVNVELRGIRVDQWVRPAETDVARVQGLVAAYGSGNVRVGANLNGSNWVSASNLQTLTEKTYKQTNPLGVLQDIAFQTDKQFFVTIDKELWYDGWDSTNYSCPFRITDDPAELKANPTTTLAIVPDVGALFAINGQQFISDVRVYYGSADDQYVDASDPGIESVKAHWAETVYAPEVVTTASEATDYANTLLAERSQDGRTFTLSVSHASGGPLTGEQIGSIKPGMLISIKARVLPFFIAGTLQPNYSYYHTRIVSLQWHMPLPNQYFATLKLERPEKTYGIGTKPAPRPAGTGVPELVSCGWNPGGTSALALNIPAGLTDSMLVVAGGWLKNIPYTAKWTPFGGTAENMTAVSGGSISHSTSSPHLQLFYLLNPTASPAPGTPGGIDVFDSLAGGTWKGYWLLQHVNQSDPFGDVEVAQGTGTTSALTLGGTGLYLNTAFVIEAGASVAPTPVAGQTECWAAGFGGPEGLEFGGGHGDATPGWTFAASRKWIVGGVTVQGLGSTTEPTGDTGDAGTDTGEFANPNHVHAHGTHTADYHTNYVQEADANWVDLTDGGATTLHSHAGGGMTNPMTSVGDVIKGGTAGAAERLAVGGSNFLFKSTGTTPEWANTARLSFLDVDEHTPPNPPSPPASVIRIYGSNSKGFYKNSSGTVVELGGAGGGGGANLTIEEVDGSPTVAATKLVLPNTTLSVVGTVVTYTPTAGGSSKYSPDNAPATTPAVSDEFDDASFTGWSWDSTPATVDESTYPGFVYIDGDSTERHMNRAWAPGATDITLAAKIITTEIPGGEVSTGLGIYVGDTTGNPANSVLWQLESGGAFAAYNENGAGSFSNLFTSTALLTDLIHGAFYLMIQRSITGPVWRFYWSATGLPGSWHQFTTTGSKSLTIAAFGVRADTDSQWSVDWIRAWDSLVSKVGS